MKKEKKKPGNEAILSLLYKPGLTHDYSGVLKHRKKRSHPHMNKIQKNTTQVNKGLPAVAM